MQTDRLYFRPFTYDDFDSLFDILNNENVCKYLPGEGKKSKDEVSKWLQHFVRTFDDELGNKIYAIYLKDSSQVIAYGGLSYVREFGQIEVMYGINETFWQKGYGTEISLRIMTLAKELDIGLLIGLADISNEGSQKILLKTGFVEIKQIPLWGMQLYYYEMKL